jgi:YHS domain-containing protein
MFTYVQVPDFEGGFMKKHYRLFAIVAVFSLIAVLSVVAQQKGDETAKDPICGMSVKIADAKLTAEYQGKTFYFCSEGCKKEFLKDPAKYAAPAAEAPKAEAMEKGCGMCCQGCCGMMAKMQTMPLTDAQKEMIKMHGQMPAPPAPGAPPAAPMPPMAGMHGGMMPNCPMMKDAPMFWCPMMMRGHMGMRHGMRMGRGIGPMGMPMGHGMASECPMCAMKSAGLETTVENTKDGVVVKITAKDAEKVKMIQDKWAQKKAACDPALCPMKKKAEAEKKEAEKK